MGTDGAWAPSSNAPNAPLLLDDNTGIWKLDAGCVKVIASVYPTSSNLKLAQDV